MTSSPKKAQRLQRIKQAASTIQDWLHRHWMWLALGVFGFFTAAAVARRKNAVTAVDTAIEVQKSRNKVRQLEQEITQLDRRDGEKANEIVKLNFEIIEEKKKLAQQVTGKPWEQLSDEELHRTLRELGLGK